MTIKKTIIVLESIEVRINESYEHFGYSNKASQVNELNWYSQLYKLCI